MFHVGCPPQGSLLNSLLPLIEAFLTSLGVRLSRLRVEWKIFENKMFPEHHLLGQPLWNYVEDVRLGYLGDCSEIPRGKKRLTAPLVYRNLKQLV